MYFYTMYTNMQKNGTCAESSFKSRSALFNLFNKYGIHWLQSIPLFSWKEKRKKSISLSLELYCITMISF